MFRIARLLFAIAVAMGTTALPVVAGKPQNAKPFVVAGSALPSKGQSPAGIDWSYKAKLPAGSAQAKPQPEPPKPAPGAFRPAGSPRILPAGSGLKLPAGSIGSPAASAIPKQKLRDRIGSLSGSITGFVELAGCGAHPDNVRIRVTGGGRTRDVTGMSVPGNDFAIRYSVGGLQAGRYVLTPSLVGVRCTGGSWSPGSAAVSLATGLSAARQNFGYTVPLAETRISDGVLTSVIQAVFTGTQIRLNNYGTHRRDTWHLPNDSFVRLPRTLGGREVRFTIPEIRENPFRYYVRDINLNNIRVAREGGAIKLSFQFESNGTELKGHCWGTSFFLDPVCPVGNDDSAPDAHLNNLRVDVFLTPARFLSGSGPVGLSFGDVRVEASVSADVNGIVGEIPGINGFIEREVKNQLRNQLRAMIDQRSVRAQVAAGLRPTLDGLHIGTIQEVRFVGSSLVIRYLPV